jgi:hypothetical protein
MIDGLAHAAVLSLAGEFVVSVAKRRKRTSDNGVSASRLGKIAQTGTKGHNDWAMRCAGAAN